MLEKKENDIAALKIKLETKVSDSEEAKSIQTEMEDAIINSRGQTSKIMEVLATRLGQLEMSAAGSRNNASIRFLVRSLTAARLIGDAFESISAKHTPAVYFNNALGSLRKSQALIAALITPEYKTSAIQEMSPWQFDNWMVENTDTKISATSNQKKTKELLNSAGKTQMWYNHKDKHFTMGHTFAEAKTPVEEYEKTFKLNIEDEY